MFIRSNRGISLSSATVYPTTNSSNSHPSETMTKLMGVLVVLLASDFHLISNVFAYVL